jgi:hypothetical protein
VCGLLFHPYCVLKEPQDLSSLNAARRPFTPPIHVLILPSKIPLDLRLHFRDLDEERMVRRMGASSLELGQLTLSLQNGTYQPDHMNLLELSEALFDVGYACSFLYQTHQFSHAQLESVRWEKSRLKDPTMLPLGIDPTCLP